MEVIEEETLEDYEQVTLSRGAGKAKIGENIETGRCDSLNAWRIREAKGKWVNNRLRERRKRKKRKD